MTHLHLGAERRQKRTLSPRLQQAVQLLQMSSLDFAAMMRRKIDDNPFLEEQDEAQAPDRELWLARPPRARGPAGTDDVGALEQVASDTTLAMHLHGQLNLVPLSERELCMARAVIESLDDDGYLRIPLEEITMALQASPPPQPEELMIALRRVQSLEPAGVGARSVRECLLLQCPRIEDAGLRALARTIAAGHLQTLARHNVSQLSLALGQPAARVRQAMKCLLRLSPRPGWSCGTSRIDSIVPDVTVRRTRDGWSVQLNPAIVPRVRLNTVYEHLLLHHQGDGHAPLAAHLQDARWTVRNVEQRLSTILDVARAIARRQRLFLEFGAMAMKPLMLREIAEEVGVHESTVSRATSHKYMATPQGTFELRHFFSRPLHSVSGQACSAIAIRELIGDMVAAEPPGQPLSDGEITQQLAAQGLVLARRTVTKYRQMLRIAPAGQRRGPASRA